MSNLSPQLSGPIIIQSQDAKTYLNAMGINIDHVHEALQVGEQVAGNTRRSAPVTAAGSRRWFSVTEVLREKLKDEGGWELTDPNNRPLVTSPNEKYTLGIIGGDSATGNPDLTPKAHRKKGRATQEAVNSAQPTLFELEKPINNPSSSEYGRDDAVPPAGGWFLLYHRGHEEIRCEISLPAADFAEGQFGSWLVRIILPSISDVIDEKKITDIGGGDIDFYVA